MKKIKSYLTISIMFSIVLIFSACASKTWIPLNTLKVDLNNKAKTYTTVYSKDYFKVGFMSVTSTITGGFVGPIEGDIIKSVEENNRRKNSNEFEKKLGDFDVLTCFYKALKNVQDSIRCFQIESTFDKNENSKIIKCLETNDINKVDKSYTETLTKSNYKYISAIRIQYGIGARAGGEQFGMTKTYRPYIKLVCIIKDINSNESVWGNRIIVFSESSYKGSDAAINADQKLLVQQFEDICANLAKFFMNDLNGYRYLSKDQLVGETFDENLL
jgi:hypothetical protein